MSKILKISDNGKDFGYVTLKGEVFYGGGSRSEAAKFDLEKYKNESNTFYFKLTGTKESYMDVKAASSRIQIVKPTFSVDSSSICAWRIENQELQMIISSHFTGKCLSRSTDDKESKALYGNIMGSHCTVTMEEVAKNEMEEA